MTDSDHARLRTQYKVIGRTLVVKLGGVKRVLSSAPQGGGFRFASYILNHQVDPTPKTNEVLSHPARYLRCVATGLHLNKPIVGLMTAVPMTQLVMARATVGTLWVECFSTVGVTNAVRAGEWPVRPARERGRVVPGTINLILITNGSLSTSAMVGAVQVATEAKTSILQQQAVPSWDGMLATGTGTDAVVIACQPRGQGPWHPYSGMHTTLGAMVGHVVATCVALGLVKARKWQEAHR